MPDGCTVWIPWSAHRLAEVFDRSLRPYLLGKLESLDFETEYRHLLLEEIKWIDLMDCTLVAIHERPLAMGVEFSESWMALQFFLTWAKDSKHWRIS